MDFPVSFACLQSEGVIDGNQEGGKLFLEG